MKTKNTPAPKEANKNVHFVSLGCARNLVDSEVMAGLLNKNGYAISPEASEAELIVVNTCGFIDQAKEESIDAIIEAARYKEKDTGKCQKLVVTGCLAERYSADLKASLPEVDLVMGTAGFAQIVEEVSKLDIKGTSKPSARVSVKHERLKDYDLPRLNSQPFYTAYLKLAEGCAKRCSFCIIPKLRGPLRSRSIETLVDEAKSLVKGGVRELNLIAQDLTDFGRDRKDGATLAGLLKELVKVKGLDWIRLFYVYPDQLTDDVIELIKKEPKICKYLDVPVQHIDDRILTNMNRKTNGKQIRDMVLRLKKEIPDITLRTSLMVGFPGESKEQFETLKKFVKEGLFDHVGVFRYSEEEGTASSKFKDDISLEEKERRVASLYKEQQKVQEKLLKKWIGKTLTVLVEGFHPETELLLKGRSYGQAPEIDNSVLINSGTADVGSLVSVKITGNVGLDLLGEIIES